MFRVSSLIHVLRVRTGRLLPALLAGLAGCMLFDQHRDREDSAPSGQARFVISLAEHRSHLAKAASDTIFDLDSLYIELTAEDVDTVRVAQALAGRPDTGAIALNLLPVELAALRNWKAVLHTIDRVDSVTRDTVHRDSVVFAVRPADTVLVEKTLAPAYAILRARFLSSVADSIPDNVLYVRLRVGGVTRDSAILGGRNATLRWLQAMPGQVIYAAGDSGRFLRSTNDAQTTDEGAWQEKVLTTQRLVGGYFPGSDAGYVFSEAGQTFATTDSGQNFVERTALPDSVRAAWFTGATTGFVVGRGGGIYKTQNSGNSWFTLASNTTRTLNGLSFPTADIGYVVGENETILKTVNGSANGGDPPEFGGIVWSPVAGGWFNQTSGSTQNIRGVHFLSADTGWAVGAGNYVRVTYNGGAVWASRDVSGVNANAVTFTSPGTGWIVADGGVIRKFVSEWDWRNLTTGTSSDLLAVEAVGSDTAWVAGEGGTVRRTVNGSATPSSITWAAQAVPGPAAWTPASSGTAAALHAVHFTSGAEGIAVGAGGVIRATADTGGSWDGRGSGTSSTLRGVHFANATLGAAVGDGEAITRTEDGGATWTAFPPSWEDQDAGTAAALHGLHYANATTGWAVGAGGVIRATTDGGANWSGQSSGTSSSLRAVKFFDADRGIAVGDGEAITRTVDGGLNWTALPAVGWSGLTSGTGEDILALHFLDATTGWLTGAAGVLRKTVDGGQNWTADSSGTNHSLRGVFALTTDKAVAVGDSGLVLRTADGGATWTPQTSGVTTDLRGTYFGSGSNGWFVGDGGTIRISTDTGKTWTSQSGAAGRLNAVFSNGSRVWVVGDSGRIYRRTSIAIGSFSAVSNGAIDEQHLYGAHFTTSNIGYVVGENGLIARCSNNGNNDWVVQSSGVSEDLMAVRFVTATTGYVVGREGTVLKTINSGTDWTVMGNIGAGSADLRALFTRGDSVYVAGDGGTLRRSPTGGTRSGRSTPQSLSDLRYVSAAVVYAVGDSGTLLRSQDSGATWTPLNSGTTAHLNGLAGNGTSRLLAVGAGGIVVRSTNPTNANPSFTQPSQTATSETLHGIAMLASNNTAYAVGDNGTIIKTRNSNNTPWVAKTSGTTAHLRSVFFKGNGTLDTGYVVGDGGVVLRSLDSGHTWSQVPSGTGEHLYAVHFAGGVDTVTIAGAAGTIRKSYTGGGWSGMDSPALRGVHFHSATVGYAAGDSGLILNTRDGGATWRPRAAGTTARLNAVSGFSTTRLLAVGDGGVVVRSANPTSSPPTIAPVTQSATSENLHAVVVLSTNIAIAVGDDGTIIKCNISTNDVWDLKGVGLTTDDLVAIHFADANTGFATGRNGTVLKTTDAGENWSVLDAGTMADLEAVRALSTSIVIAAGAGGTVVKTTAGGFIADTTTVRGLDAADAVTAWLVGDAGLVAKTVNAGAAWILQDGGTDANLHGVGFIDATTGWFVGDSGTIHRTEDGGATWSPQTSGTSVTLRSVQAVSADTAFASGDGGILLKTVDGGATWYEQESPTMQNLNRVFFLNPEVGFAVGDSGTILNAVNEGDNWTGGGVKRALKAVHFINADTGWIAGEDAVILKTVDGGATWAEQYRDAGDTLHGLWFSNSSTGWATGDGGLILKTTDGGVTWVPQNSGTGIALRWVNFRDTDRGFVIGGTESILETEDGGSNWAGLFVGVPGDRAFDRTLATKYLRTGQPQEVIMDAMDRFSLPLRGYQVVLNLDVTPGADSTLFAPLTRCGHVDSIPCTP